MPIPTRAPGPGDVAPDFTLRDQFGRETTLSELRGVREALVVFYPFAFSRVCTGELAALAAAWTDLDADGLAVLGVSCDPMFALRAFAEADGIEFPLLSDFWPHGAVATAYGVFDDRAGCPRRSSFLVDLDGVVRWSVHNPMGEARDLDEAREALARLRSQP